MKIGRPPGLTISNKQKDEILQLCKMGLNKSEIAQKLGVHRNTIRNWLNSDNNLRIECKLLLKKPTKKKKEIIKPQEQQYNLFRSQSLIVGVICLSGGKHAAASTGMKVILSELRYQYEYIPVKLIKEYKIS